MTSDADRRAIFLEEMGLAPLWVPRAAPLAAVAPVADQLAVPPAAAAQDMPATSGKPALPVMAVDLPGVARASETVGLSGNIGADAAAITAPGATAPSAAEIERMDWTQLKAALAGCVKCGLCRSRTRTVFGVGDEKARWLFVGEGPGRNEDLQGEPFVGPAGKLLDNMLLAMGLRRGENAYIANIVKCRPIGEDGRDRPPAPDEAAACMPYLQRQIALINPTIIVALGKTAAMSLLGLEKDTALAKLRGTVHNYSGLPLVVTYHPAYLLRKLTDKGKTWTDLCLAMKAYADA